MGRHDASMAGVHFCFPTSPPHHYLLLLLLLLLPLLPLQVILNPHIRVSSATRSRMEKRMREREARRLALTREKNACSGGAARERPAPAFVKRVVEEERRTAGWLRIFPGIANEWTALRCRGYFQYHTCNECPQKPFFSKNLEKM